MIVVTSIMNCCQRGSSSGTGDRKLLRNNAAIIGKHRQSQPHLTRPREPAALHAAS